MVGMCPLGTEQLLKAWNQVAHSHPAFCSTAIPCVALDVAAEQGLTSLGGT